MKLAERLKDPALRDAIREARVRLDAEDQRWMMNEIERLTNKTGDLRQENERLRFERDTAKQESTGRLCVECGKRESKPTIWACPCGNVSFGRRGAEILDEQVALARKHDPKIVTLSPSGEGR